MNDTLFTTLNKYKESYHIRLENHLKEYVDYDELHFIKFELEHYESSYHTANVKYRKIELGSDPNFPFKDYEYCQDLIQTQGFLKLKVMQMIIDYDSPNTNLYNLELCEKLSQSFSKIITYLHQLQNELINSTVPTAIKQIHTPKLNWAGTELELSELIKALIIANKLNSELSQTEIFKRFRDFFNVSNFKESEKLNDIRKRSNTLTPFINTLEISLSNWIKAKD